MKLTKEQVGLQVDELSLLSQWCMNAKRFGMIDRTKDNVQIKHDGFLAVKPHWSNEVVLWHLETTNDVELSSEDENKLVALFAYVERN